MKRTKKPPPKPKESGHWKPGLWDARRVRRYLLHVRRETVHAVQDMLPVGKRDATWAALIEVFDVATSRAYIHAKGYKTLGELQRGGTVDGATTGDAVVPEQKERDDSVSGKPASAE